MYSSSCLTVMSAFAFSFGKNKDIFNFYNFFFFLNNRNFKASTTVRNRVNPVIIRRYIFVFLCTFWKILQRFAKRAQLLFNNEVYNERQEQEDTIRKQTILWFCYFFFSFFSFYLNSLFATLHPYPLSFAHSRFLYHSIVFSRFNSYSRDKIISFQRFCNKKAGEVHVIQMTSYNSVSVLEGHASRATSSFSPSDSTAFIYYRGSPTLFSSRINYGLRLSAYIEKVLCKIDRKNKGWRYLLITKSVNQFV